MTTPSAIYFFSTCGKVSGYITSVCKKKGCWMILSHSPTDSTGLFVKFKDYGFFMPLDCEGSRVVMRGVANCGAERLW